MQYIKYLALGMAMVLMCFSFGAGAERKEFTASINTDGIQRVEILGGSYFFDPNYIIVKVNVPVEVKIRKEGIIPHDIMLRAPEAGMDINVTLDTDAKIITFTPTKTGTYPFYCSKKGFLMGSHREKGMEGVIEVRE